MADLLVVGVLFALVVVRTLILGAGILLLVRPVRACPACGHETIPVRVPFLRFLPGRLEWRWCAACRWEGPARRSRGEGGAAPRSDVRHGNPARR